MLRSSVYFMVSEGAMKQHGGNRGLYVNSAGRDSLTETQPFTVYACPYLTYDSEDRYIKHVYMGGERVVSKIGNANDIDRFYNAERVLPDSTCNSIYGAMTDAIRQRYSYMGVPCGIVDGPAAMRQGAAQAPIHQVAYEGGQYYYTLDHLGSTTLITDTARAAVQHIEYLPYGEVFMEETGDTWNTPYKFNGKEYDGETGLYYYGARYLDPKLCIWYGADPKENDYPSISTYCYTLGNPVKTIDPDGNSPLTKFVKAGMKISAKVGKDGIKALGQASTYTQAVSDISNDINTLFDSNSTVSERVIAGASIVSEALPISLNDAKSIAKSGKRFLNKLSERTIGNTKKPYSKSRPKYGKGQVENVWNNAKESEGKVYDPNIGIELHWDITKPRKGQWDMGHKPDAKYSDLHRDYMDGKITKEEFLHRYRDPNNYRPELPINNRSHK